MEKSRTSRLFLFYNKIVQNSESGIVNLSLRLAVKVRLYQLPIYVFVIVLAFLSSSVEADDVSIIGYGLIAYIILGIMASISYFLFIRHAVSLLKNAKVVQSSLILYVASMLDLFSLITAVTIASTNADMLLIIAVLPAFFILSYLSFLLPLRFFTRQSLN